MNNGYIEWSDIKENIEQVNNTLYKLEEDFKDELYERRNPFPKDEPHVRGLNNPYKDGILKCLNLEDEESNE